MTEVSNGVTGFSQPEADRRYAQLQHAVGELARRAQSLDDVETVARHVRLLRLHAPRTYDVLASAALDGSDYVEHGFAAGDGFIGTLEPQVLCGHHDELTPWPCPALRELSAAVQTEPAAAV